MESRRAMDNAAFVPACVTVAGLAWSALMQWLRVRPGDAPTDSRFAPAREHLTLLAAAGEVVAVAAAVLLFVLA